MTKPLRHGHKTIARTVPQTAKEVAKEPRNSPTRLHLLPCWSNCKTIKIKPPKSVTRP